MTALADMTADMTADWPSEPLDLPALAEIDAELARRSLVEFVRQGWDVLEPQTPIAWGLHIDAICDHLEAVTAGQIKRLVINIPPRHGKSTLVSVLWPAWEWINAPHRRWVFASYSDELACLHSVFRRKLLSSDWYQERFGGRFLLAGDMQRQREFGNDMGGRMVAAGIGGSLTGKGGDRVVIDDPHNPKQAESELERKTTIRDIRLTLFTRLDQPAEGAIVMVMQRLHEADATGELLKDGGWTHLCLPSEAEMRTVVSLPFSGRQIVREQGDLLCPSRFPQQVLDGFKRELGSAGYAGQHGQRPAPAEGLKFKRPWLRYFKDAGTHYELADGRKVPRNACRRFATVDTAFSTKETADYTVIAVWALTPAGDLLLTELQRGHWEDPDVERLIRNVLSSGKASYAAIEKKQNGATCLQRLVRDGLHVKALEADTDKLTRATLAAIDMENGKLHFLAGAPWLADLEQELLTFPNAAHDDQVDAVSYAAIEKSSSPSLPSLSGAPVRTITAGAS